MTTEKTSKTKEALNKEIKEELSINIGDNLKGRSLPLLKSSTFSCFSSTQYVEINGITIKDDVVSVGGRQFIFWLRGIAEIISDTEIRYVAHWVNGSSRIIRTLNSVLGKGSATTSRTRTF